MRGYHFELERLALVDALNSVDGQDCKELPANPLHKVPNAMICRSYTVA